MLKNLNFFFITICKFFYLVKWFLYKKMIKIIKRKFTCHARIFARLANTGSVAKASVSPHSSTVCKICNIFGCLNRSNCLTDARKISVIVSFRFGLCSFSATRFSNKKTEHSYKKKILLFVVV